MDIASVDFSSIGFLALMTIGFVNVLTFFFASMDSRMKFGISFLFAFALTFVPTTIADVIVQNAKLALEAAFVASGLYKLSQKVGGTQ